MDKKHIEIKATHALAHMRSNTGKAKGELVPLLQLMYEACDTINKSEDGAQAIKALLNLWRELKLKDINGASISELSDVVAGMYLKSINEDKAD